MTKTLFSYLKQSVDINLITGLLSDHVQVSADEGHIFLTQFIRWLLEKENHFTLKIDVRLQSQIVL